MERGAWRERGERERKSDFMETSTINKLSWLLINSTVASILEFLHPSGASLSNGFENLSVRG